MSALAPPAGFEQLTVDEKIEYVQRLWDMIAVDSSDVPDSQSELLRDRLARLRDAPDEGADWATVRDRLRDRR